MARKRAMKWNICVAITILNANNQVANNRYIRAIIGKLLVCVGFASYFSVSMNWWSKSTSYISPSFSWPDANIQLSSKVLRVSAVLKSWFLPVSDVYEMFSCVSSFIALRIVSELQVRSVGWSERWFIKWIVTSSIHEPLQKYILMRERMISLYW